MWTKLHKYCQFTFKKQAHTQYKVLELWPINSKLFNFLSVFVSSFFKFQILMFQIDDKTWEAAGFWSPWLQLLAKNLRPVDSTKNVAKSWMVKLKITLWKRCARYYVFSVFGYYITDILNLYFIFVSKRLRTKT